MSNALPIAGRDLHCRGQIATYAASARLSLDLQLHSTRRVCSANTCSSQVVAAGYATAALVICLWTSGTQLHGAAR